MEEKIEYLAEEKKAVKQKLIAVKVLDVTPFVALVEWQTGELRQRVYIQPDALLPGNKVEEARLLEGAPASIAWEKILKPRQVTGLDFAKALQEAEIFTKADVYNKFSRLMGVVQKVYGIEIASIVQAVEASGK